METDYYFSLPIFLYLCLLNSHYNKKNKLIVCIAEKPSVARDIADILGARERKEGILKETDTRLPGHSVIFVP